MERGAAATDASKPLTPTEAKLADIWMAVLGVERLRVEDNFFELGGHSLMALRTMSRIREAFGLEVPLRALFEGPTLGKLAEIIDGLQWIAPASASPPVTGSQEEIAL
jgi:acyl carrier protein